jgi:GT2 family glycosyltransferase
MKRTLSYEGVNPCVMLVHNALSLTKEAVRSVLEQDVPVMLHVVNNHSTDGTEEWLLENDVEHTTFKPALGVSAGWNFALVNAFRKTGHCLVINNDVSLRPDTYRSLLEDGGDFVTAVSVDNVEGIQGDWRKAPRPHPDFSCFLIRKKVWEAVGLFDESMMLYASDADYHLRMHKAGITAYTIGIPFFHYASGTLKYASPGEKASISHQADKDRHTFEQKWGCKVGSDSYYKLFGHGAPDEKAEA